MAIAEKWREHMQDVKDYITPYQHSVDPIALVTDFLYESKFTDFQVEIKDRLYIYLDVDILKASVKSVNPFISRLSVQDQEEFIEEYVQHVTEMGLKTDEGKFLTPYKLMIIHATK